MAITNQKLIERDRIKLATNIREAKRQMEFLGVRFGVMAELSKLDKQRQRIVNRLVERDPESATEYRAKLGEL